MTIGPDWFIGAFAASRSVQARAPTLPPCGMLLQHSPSGDDRELAEGRVWEELNGQYPFLWRAEAGLPPTEDELRQFGALLGWMTEGLCTWSPNRADASELLAALLLVIVRLAMMSADLAYAPVGIGPNAELVEALVGLLREWRPQVEVEGWVSYRDMRARARRLIAAGEARNWEGIAADYEACEFMFPPSALTGAVRLLAHFAPDRLRQAGDLASNILSAAIVARALSVPDALGLASASNNSLLQFACTYSKLHREREPLDENVQTQLTSIFINAAGDRDVWRGWMAVFNRYPVRFRQIQRPLGRALAELPRQALATYIGSLSLHTTPHDERLLVGTCMDAFSEAATLSKRKLLWRLAFDRWRTWRFDEASPSTHVFDVSWSALDYGVVGYYLDCNSPKELEGAITEEAGRLAEVDHGWHTDLTQCISAWYRSQSALQPAVHAQQVRTDDRPWLADKLYLASPLADPSGYFDRKHRLHRRELSGA